MRLSASQIKTYSASKAKRAGQYILWVKDEFQNDSFNVGNLFELRLTKWVEDFQILEWVQDLEKAIQDFDNLKHNAEWLEFKSWDIQVFLQWEINGVEFVWYADNIIDGVIEDIKTCKYPTNIESGAINMWSGMTTYQEYELQIRIYMVLTWLKKWRIIEVAKHKYKDEKPRNQIIEFKWSDKWNKQMEDKFFPIIDEMMTLYAQYNRWTTT